MMGSCFARTGLRREMGARRTRIYWIIALVSVGVSFASPSFASARDRRVCGLPAAGIPQCFALKRTDIKPRRQAQINANPALHFSGSAAPVGFGYTPSQLRSAYNLTAASASNGGGMTVAVVDAFNDPTAASDLAIYRSAMGLPACGAGCFTVLNQNGATSPLPATAPTSDDWTLEESLDLDMVSAICPNCKIDLVEANDDSGTGLYTAENTAVAAGAAFITNSWGGPESSSDVSLDSTFFNHPGVAITASAGDGGYGVIYPAASPDVVAVGGTTLNVASTTRGWTETVWSGSGSGCSAFEPKPSWQTDTGCSRRTVSDVAAVADPYTGVAVYDTTNGNGGWNEVGGTSASSPIIAATYALAGRPAAGTNPASYLYAHPSALYDVTSGADGSCAPAYLCTGEVGYDGPTGLGTPNGVSALTSGSPGATVTVTNPGNQSTKAGTAVSVQIHATDSTGAPLTYSATGLPPGLSISSTGLISGTPTTAGTFSVTVTAKDPTGASGKRIVHLVDYDRRQLHARAALGQPRL